MPVTLVVTPTQPNADPALNHRIANSHFCNWYYATKGEVGYANLLVKVCISKCRDYAAIDLARTGTIKHDNLCLGGRGTDWRMMGFWNESLDWPVTMSYNELLICNPGCNPRCNPDGPGIFARDQRGHQDRLSTQTDWRVCKCMLNQCSDYDDA